MRFEIGRGGPSQRDDRGAARLLVLGDFGARAHGGAANPVPLERRAVIAVDNDTLDAAMARIAPRLRATFDDGTAVDIGPAAIDDLHPDRLVERHPPLAALVAQRRRLLDPARFAGAAAELGPLARDARSAATPASAAEVRLATPAGEDDQSTLSRLLGDSPAAREASPGAAAARAVDALVRQIAAGAERPPVLEGQAQYLAEVDRRATAELRRVLHLPAFQSLESCWRGVQFLVARLELGEDLQLQLLDVTLEELRADAAAAGNEPGRSALARRLRRLADESAEGEPAWRLAAGLYRFGAADLELLASIAAAARAAGLGFVAGADGSIAGRCPEPSEWRPPAAADLARYETFRSSEIATAVGLVAPRFLLRLPYGRASDAIDSFAFEELASSAPAPGELLWGEGALAAALVRARAADDDALDIADLPAVTYISGAEPQLQCCAEELIGAGPAEQLVELGLMPLLGSRHRNAVRLAGFRTIAGR